MENFKNKYIITPEKLLADGVDSAVLTNPFTGQKSQVRKGTIAAMLSNASVLNQLLQQAEHSKEDEKQIIELCTAIKSLIPSLKTTGMFDLFTPFEWLNSKEQLGRVLIVILYLQQYPQEINSNIKTLLENIKNNNIPNVVKLELSKLL